MVEHMLYRPLHCVLSSPPYPNFLLSFARRLLPVIAQLGYQATYIIGTLSLPTFIFLYYAAIKKGQAEVEEDDAKYNGRW